MHNFNSLQYNLCEIYAALHVQQNQGGDLPLSCASPSSVYYQRSWMGQIRQKWDKTWSWIRPTSDSHSVENALKFILGPLFNHAVHLTYDLRQRRIWNNMHQIDEIWKNDPQPLDLDGQRLRYVRFLSSELEGSIEENSPIYLADFDQRTKKILSGSEEGEHRRIVVNFHQATYIFWSIFIKDNQEMRALRNSLDHFVDPSSSTLTDKALFKSLKKERYWVQVGGLTQQAIPVALLSKLHDSQNLKVEENRQLRRWIHSLNHCVPPISPKILSIVLEEVMNVISLQGSSSITLQDLLFWLNQQGCQMIPQEDPVHMDWREGLSPGDSIECNGKELVLGKQLSTKKYIDDIYKIFELSAHPNYVVKIAHNRFRLLVEDKQWESEEEHWGFRGVEKIDNLEEDDQKPVINGLDRQGRCVVLEKLYSPIESHVWTSTEAELSKNDQRIALVFANHIYCMSQWRASAQNLSLAHLMWDNAGNLKSTRLLKKGPCNYNEWETYCESAARGNLFVLTYLMNVSKLNEHEVGIYYRKAVEYTLKTGETDLIGRPLPLRHRQEHYNRLVKDLCAQAQELRSSCLKLMIADLRKKKNYSHKQEEDLQNDVAAKLLELYLASPTPGRFAVDLEDEVVRNLSSPPKNTAHLKPFDAKAYYEDEHELMMSHNKSFLSALPPG
jgi:hypothetical protein